MKKARHQISFDLDTVTLRESYPGNHYNNAYLDIRRVMEQYGFEHRQGSVYISKEEVVLPFVFKTIKQLTQKCPWTKVCMRDCVVSTIGDDYDLNHFFERSLEHDAKKQREAKQEPERKPLKDLMADARFKADVTNAQKPSTPRISKDNIEL